MGFLNLELAPQYAFVEKEKGRGYGFAGMRGQFRTNYRDETTYQDNSVETDGLKGRFRKNFGSVFIGLGGEYVIKEQIRLFFEAKTALYQVKLDDLEWLEIKQFAPQIGIGTRFFLSGK